MRILSSIECAMIFGGQDAPPSGGGTSPGGGTTDQKLDKLQEQVDQQKRIDDCEAGFQNFGRSTGAIIGGAASIGGAFETGGATLFGFGVAVSGGAGMGDMAGSMFGEWACPGMGAGNQGAGGTQGSGN